MNLKLIFSIFFTFTINAEISLFKFYSQLKDKLAHVSFCDLPTPIHKLENLCEYLNCKNIYIKRDDLSGLKLENGTHLYGGNKTRKLEFLLADAIKQNAKTIVTYGCVGSNHALATALYSNHLGLQSILMLKPEPNSKIVRQNLLLDKFYNAQFKFYPNNQMRNAACSKLLSENKEFYFFPTGGSVALGTIGYVNAAFELKEQVDNNVIHEPDFIYLPISSCGTTSGLLLGLKAAKLKSKVIAVAIEPEEEKNIFENNTKKLFIETNQLLNILDKDFEIYEFPNDQFHVNKKFWGTEYGLFTKETVETKKLFNGLENIILDCIYTAKPMAALIEDVSKNTIQEKVILFWNTYCAINYSEITKNVNYKDLPIEFHKYFEEDVQELDK